MRSISIKVPEQVVSEAKDYIKAGLFKSESDIFITATIDFFRRNRIELVERFAREDIEWAKKEASKRHDKNSR